MEKNIREIYNEIQGLEEIIDNIKGDMEIYADENIDETTRHDAFSALMELCNNISKEEITIRSLLTENLNERINAKAKGEYKS